jgi:predicted nuclease of predicted toxin-antitoxin system
MTTDASPRLFIALYTDADVDQKLAEQLRRRRFDAVSAREIGQYQSSDEEQLDYAILQGRAVLTFNSRHWEPLFEEY